MCNEQYMSPRLGLKRRYRNDSINISRLWRFGLGSKAAAKPIPFTPAIESAGEFLRFVNALIPTKAGAANACRALQLVRPR